MSKDDKKRSDHDNCSLREAWTLSGLTEKEFKHYLDQDLIRPVGTRRYTRGNQQLFSKQDVIDLVWMRSLRTIDILTILKHTSLTHLVSPFLTHQPQTLYARCPLCIPSCRICVERDRFTCDTCGNYGTAIDFLCISKNLTVPQALATLARNGTT